MLTHRGEDSLAAYIYIYERNIYSNFCISNKGSASTTRLPVREQVGQKNIYIPGSSSACSLEKRADGAQNLMNMILQG